MSNTNLKIKVYSQTGEEVGDLDLNPKFFGVEVKDSVIHQAVVAQMANARQVLAHTKDRSEVRGGGKKPWKQKGTGNARHGSRRSPIWVGGGVTFGPTKERNFSVKINKKIKQKALLMGLSDKVVAKKFIILDKLNLSQGKTREILEIFGKLPLKEKKSRTDKTDSRPSILLVSLKSNEKNILAARNLSKVKNILANSLNIVDILKYEYFIIEKSGIAEIEKTYSRSVSNKK